MITLNDRYQLIEKLGSGGMATVYRAQDLTLERSVAIKILHADFSTIDDFRDRFHQEAKAAANLSHPSIVTVHDFGFTHDKLFIIMEYIHGTDLKSLINQRGQFSIKDGLSLIIQACAGIGYAHRAGLVHCDVKPQNMLVTPDQRLKVTDFGIARAYASINPDDQSDVVWGSPQYFSPEQATGRPPSPASDVYSLGVIMYEMFTGQLPFTAREPNTLARLHREVHPLPPSRLVPDIPPLLEQIILKVLAKEPSARYRTADQLGRVIIGFQEQYLNGTTDLQPSIDPDFLSEPERTQVVHHPEPVRKRNQSNTSTSNIDWMTILLGLLALVSVGGLIPFWLWVYYSSIP